MKMVTNLLIWKFFHPLASRLFICHLRSMRPWGAPQRSIRRRARFCYRAYSSGAVLGGVEGKADLCVSKAGVVSGDTRIKQGL